MADYNLGTFSITLSKNTSNLRQTLIVTSRIRGILTDNYMILICAVMDYFGIYGSTMIKALAC